MLKLEVISILPNHCAVVVVPVVVVILKLKIRIVFGNCNESERSENFSAVVGMLFWPLR